MHYAWRDRMQPSLRGMLGAFGLLRLLPAQVQLPWLAGGDIPDDALRPQRLTGAPWRGKLSHVPTCMHHITAHMASGYSKLLLHFC
jgi:hypothetical protein